MGLYDIGLQNLSASIESGFRAGEEAALMAVKKSLEEIHLITQNGLLSVPYEVARKYNPEVGTLTPDEYLDWRKKQVERKYKLEEGFVNGQVNINTLGLEDLDWITRMLGANGYKWLELYNQISLSKMSAMRSAETEIRLKNDFDSLSAYANDVIGQIQSNAKDANNNLDLIKFINESSNKINSYTNTSNEIKETSDNIFTVFANSDLFKNRETFDNALEEIKNKLFGDNINVKGLDDNTIKKVAIDYATNDIGLKNVWDQFLNQSNNNIHEAFSKFLTYLNTNTEHLQNAKDLFNKIQANYTSLHILKNIFDKKPKNYTAFTNEITDINKNPKNKYFLNQYRGKEPVDRRSLLMGIGINENLLKESLIDKSIKAVGNFVSPKKDIIIESPLEGMDKLKIQIKNDEKEQNKIYNHLNNIFQSSFGKGSIDEKKLNEMIQIGKIDLNTLLNKQVKPNTIANTIDELFMKIQNIKKASNLGLGFLEVNKIKKPKPTPTPIVSNQQKQIKTSEPVPVKLNPLNDYIKKY